MFKSYLCWDDVLMRVEFPHQHHYLPGHVTWRLSADCALVETSGQLFFQNGMKVIEFLKYKELPWRAAALYWTIARCASVLRSWNLSLTSESFLAVEKPASNRAPNNNHIKPRFPSFIFRNTHIWTRIGGLYPWSNHQTLFLRLSCVYCWPTIIFLSLYFAVWATSLSKLCTSVYQIRYCYRLGHLPLLDHLKQ